MAEQIYETFGISKTTTHLSLAIAFHDTDVLFRFKESSEKQKAIELIRHLEQYGKMSCDKRF